MDKKQRPERLSLQKHRDKLYEEFRNNLRVLNALSNLSGVELAKKIPIKSGARLTDLQYGRGNPKTEEILAICKYFEITMDEILHKKAVITFQ